MGLSLLAALSYGLAAVLGAAAGWGAGAHVLGAGDADGGGAAAGPGRPAARPPWGLPAPPFAAWAAIAVLAIVGTALAYRLYFRLMADAGPVNTSLVTFLVPVSAIAISVTALGETLLPRHIIGWC